MEKVKQNRIERIGGALKEAKVENGYVVINKITYVLAHTGTYHNGRDEHGDEIYITYAKPMDRWGYNDDKDITELRFDTYRDKYYVEVKGKKVYGKVRGVK